MTDHKNIYMALAAAQGDMGKVVKARPTHSSKASTPTYRT